MALTVNGRKIPRNDWEGDDRTPGAGGRYVTCMDTAAGRMVAYATNLRIDKDGKVYRAALRPADPNGITFDQAEQAVRTVARLPLHHKSGWSQATAQAWLKAGKGLIVIGRYDTIPRAYRHQYLAGFNHAMFVTHIDRSGKMRLYDPLNPDIYAYGRIVPASILWPFLASLGWMAGYVPLQPL